MGRVSQRSTCWHTTLIFIKLKNAIQNAKGTGRCVSMYVGEYERERKGVCVRERELRTVIKEEIRILNTSLSRRATILG